jgi:formamidopyrimidine-DNA glycosylase
LVVGRTIDDVWCDDDRIVFEGVTPRAIEEALRGRRVEAVRRKGKYLWFELDRRPWPLFHFGMTGSFRIPDQNALPLASSGRTPETQWPPRFTKIHLHLNDGGETVMTNSRRLGRIRLREDPATEPPVSRLGFDPLLEMPEEGEFRGLLRGRQGNIKGLLLNQQFAAGVGNWIADEVLFQAGIDPRRRVPDLSRSEVESLRQALRRVVEVAVDVDAEKERFPSEWLFHRRWGRQSGVTTAAGDPIEHLTVAGRTTAWVPKVQR